MTHYYQYQTDDNQYYYYKIDDGSTTYDFPVDSIIYDPNTSKCVYSPGNPIPSYARCEGRPISNETKKIQFEQKEKTTDSDDFREQQNEIHQFASVSPSIRKREMQAADLIKEQLQPVSVGHRPRRAKTFAPQSIGAIHEPVTVEVFNKDEIMKDVNNFDREALADRIIAHRKVGFLLRRRTRSIQEVIHFENQVLHKSLLSTVPKEMQKEAVKCFEAILIYTGLKKSQGVLSDNIVFLVNTAYSNEILRDEIYFQLVKQTNGNPNDDCNKKTWELLLLFTTLFTSSKDLYQYIIGHLATNLLNTEIAKNIHPIVELSYLKYKARMCSGKCAKDPGPYALLDLMKAPTKSSDCIGISINECLWVQRNIKPNSSFPQTKRCLYAPEAPIPIILDLMARRIIEKGAKNMQGIFRIPGSNKKIEETLEKINCNADCINNLEIHDICSFFKRWWAELPKKVIPDDQLETFLDIIKNSRGGHPDDKKLLNLLDPPDRIALLYLAGFLRELSTAEKTTLMGASNLALVFSPNMFNMPNDMKLAKDIQVEIQGFLMRLIQNADVEGIYPYVGNENKGK